MTFTARRDSAAPAYPMPLLASETDAPAVPAVSAVHRVAPRLSLPGDLPERLGGWVVLPAAGVPSATVSGAGETVPGGHGPGVRPVAASRPAVSPDTLLASLTALSALATTGAWIAFLIG
jgi:hypothetical protein